MPTHRKFSEADIARGQVAELVAEIDSQIVAIMGISQAAVDTGTKVFALRSNNDDVLIAAGGLVNWFPHELNAPLEILRRSKELLVTYGETII